MEEKEALQTNLSSPTPPPTTCRDDEIPTYFSP